MAKYSSIIWYVSVSPTNVFVCLVFCFCYVFLYDSWLENFVCLKKQSQPFRQTIECEFTLNLVRDMIITYSQMHRQDKY